MGASFLLRAVWTLAPLLCVLARELSSSREFLGCPAPRSPENGLSFIFNDGRIVRYRCHPGYKLRGHPHAVCTNSHWNRPAPLCLAKNGTRRGPAHTGHDKKPDHNNPSRQLFDWNGLYGSEDTKLPLINGQWRRPHHRGSRVFSLGPQSSSEQDTPKKTMLEQQLIEEEVKIAEMRHDQEQDVLSSRSQTKESSEGGVDDATADEEDEEINDVSPSTSEPEGSKHSKHAGSHSVGTSHSEDRSSEQRSRRYYRWKEDEPKEHGARYYSSRLAHTRKASGEASAKTSDTSRQNHNSEDDDVPTSTESPAVHTSSWLKETGPREFLRNPSDISDYWKSSSGGYSSERQHHTHRQLSDSPREGVEEHDTGKPKSRAMKRSYLHSDDDYEDDDEDDANDDELKVRFEGNGDTQARPIKGDRQPYDVHAERSFSTSSPVDPYGRPVQVLTGEKAHQQEALLRKQYERAEQRRALERDIEEAEARGRPEEKSPVIFDPPQRGDNEPFTSRPFDYFGRPVQVHTGEKAAQAEALLKQQYERVQSRMRENARLQEARQPPEGQTFPRQPVAPHRGDIPVRGDREDLGTHEPQRHLVTSRPYDYFGRPVQVLTGEKAAQAEEMLRRQYEQYQQQLNIRRDRHQEEVRGRPVEFERRPLQPSSGEVTSSPVDFFGRPVQVLSGEKAGQQTELLRRMYERAESSRNFQESRRRPVEEVYRHPRDHRHRHNHGQEHVADSDSYRESRDPAAEGTSGSLRLSKQDLELMSKLSPEVRESYLKDLRKARVKEETDPVRANQFLSRYQNTMKNRASQHTKSLDKEPQDDASKDDAADDDKDDYDDDDLQNDQPEEDIPLTTASTEDTSSESSEDNATRDATATFTSSKASYDQTCLRDRKLGTPFLSAPKVKHAYVYKYERKVLTKPPHSHYVLARYKCLFGYRFKYEKADALYCKQREWIGEHPHCIREES